jgi:hypothetical protein
MQIHAFLFSGKTVVSVVFDDLSCEKAMNNDSIGNCEMKKRRTMVALCAVSTNNFVTCRRTVLRTVRRTVNKLFRGKLGAKLTAVSQLPK